MHPSRLPFRLQPLPLLPFLLALLSAGFGLAGRLHAAAVPTFSGMVVFGDSLSDVGNISAQDLGVYPGPDPDPAYDYTSGSFTDGSDTDPAARTVSGVWHTQLASEFLHLKPLTASLDGGQDYAYGGAKTIDGVTQDSEDGLTVDIDNLGKQVSDYLSAHTPDASTLFCVWGGGNDLLDDPSAADVTQTANNIGSLVTRLASAGARSFIVPNVPPLGMIPEYNTTGADADTRNAASASYHDTLNTVLDQTIASLASEHINIVVYRLDVYTLFLNFIANPAEYGYVNVTDRSQGTSVNPNKYVFWDGIHPTTVGHYYLAAAAYSLISGEPVVSISAPQSKVLAGTEPDYFYLTRIGGETSNELVVPYAVSGSAAAGSFYETLPGARKLKAGHVSAKVTLYDYARDPMGLSNTVTLTLDAGAGYSLGSLNSATITIKDVPRG